MFEESREQQTLAGGDVEIEASCTAGGDVHGPATLANGPAGPLAIFAEAARALAALLPDGDPRERKTSVYRTGAWACSQ